MMPRSLQKTAVTTESGTGLVKPWHAGQCRILLLSFHCDGHPIASHLKEIVARGLICRVGGEVHERSGYPANHPRQNSVGHGVRSETARCVGSRRFASSQFLSGMKAFAVKARRCRGLNWDPVDCGPQRDDVC
jgi:hypothetical protein